jgi:hypothetical protein
LYTDINAGLTDLSEQVEAQLSSLIPRYHMVDPKCERLYLIQAIITAYMLDIFSEPHCFGLPDAGPLSHLGEVAEELRSRLDFL